MSIDNPLKTDFAGKDGFNWFFAKVVPEKNWKTVSDSLNLDGKQSHRVKIRVCGHDPFDESVLPDSECRWAQLTSDPKFGNGVEGLGETNCMVGGESVLGFFCDGPDGQVPVILASLPAASTEVENRRNNLENGNNTTNPPKVTELHFACCACVLHMHVAWHASRACCICMLQFANGMWFLPPRGAL